MIGKWNKSVIVTYVGMLLAVVSMILIMADKMSFAMMCFMVSGICDMFDGTVARMCKRTEEEKNFGIQLDSLADVIDFIALPVVLVIKVCGVQWYSVAACLLYAVFGVARLAYFNVCQEENEDKDSPIKYYTGLPVTFAAMIFSLAYLSVMWVDQAVTGYILCGAMVITAMLYILKIKVIKPRRIGYIFFLLLAVVLFVLYFRLGR